MQTKIGTDRSEAKPPRVDDAILSVVTPTQATRLAKHLAGASVREIARNEGVAKSSVQESLSSPNVRRALTIFGFEIQAMDRVNGTTTTAIKIALETLINMTCDGTRPIVVGERVEYVRDDRLRMEAACRLLSYVDKPAPPKPSAPPLPTVEIERTVTASERRVTRPGHPLPPGDDGAA
ncbi:MAG: hypothetical protein HKL92_01950 [Candidatus Eremiobacteraeota bacterium]|nr:hypothetical protein [Candidatus Eremiobacteraeota bacterium]